MRIAVLAAVLTALWGCGLFTPLEPDPPGVSRPRDQLGFAAILAGHPGENLAVNDYADMFTPSFVYYNAAGNAWSRERVITRLRTLNDRISSDDTLVVTWAKPGLQGEIFDRNKALTLQPRTWHVTRTVRNPSAVSAYVGESTFTIVYDGILDAWRISSWSDRSTDPLHPLSCFHPDFSE